MNCYPAPTPCPAPLAAGSLGAAACYAPIHPCAHDPHRDSTTNVDYTADFTQSLYHVKPRRRPAHPKKPPAWDPDTDIWVDEPAADPRRPMPPQPRPKPARQSALFTLPAQKMPMPMPQDDDALRPRRRRVSALLAEKGLRSTAHPAAHPAARHDEKAKKPELLKDPRRRTIYVPSDDTTIMTIHPGFPQPTRRPRSPDLGFDLVTLSEEDPDQPPPAIKRNRAPRKSLAAAPKRGPLRQSSRPLQGVSFVEDVVGKTLGKENIPPGVLLKDCKQLRPSAAVPSDSKPRTKPAAKPEPARKERLRPAAPTSSSAAKNAVTRKRTSSDSVGSPSKAIRTARATAITRPPLLDAATKRQTRSSTSNPSSPFYISRSPPQALRRNRVEKPPSKLSVPRVPQKAQQQDKYPVLSEDLDKPQLYEDNWLSYQEVSITQLVNKLFDCVDLSSQDEGQEDGALRRKLLAVYQDPSVPLLHKRLQASLMYGALSIPKDLLAKALRLKDDVGLRRKYLNLFVNVYEPPVLRAAAEAIVGRECPVSSRLSSGSSASDCDQRQRRAEKKAIEGFLDTFFIRNEDAVRVKTGIGSISSIARGRDKGDDFGSEGWLWRRTTLRSLMLVLLLDMSKTKDVVNIPLFQVSSPYKSSDAVLQELASMLLPSLGDLSRPLGHLDYHLHCVQYPLQEYKYRVENLATDLRDGVLLTRLVELLLYPPTVLALQKDVTITMPTGDILTSCFSVGDAESWVLSQHLKFPCIGRAQKLYNLQIALSALGGVKGIAGQAVKDVTAEDIVDGHREKTLGLLWGLVGKWGLEALVDWKELENETQRYRSRYYDQQPDDYQDPDSEDESELAELQGLEKYTALLRGWARSIARLRGLRVANLTTSFSDGLAIEAIVDEYIACFPASSTAAALANAPTSSTGSLAAKLKSIGCSNAFISLFTNTSITTRPIPSKDFTITTLTFLASRLLPASRAHRAAVTLQRWYRIRLSRREVSKRVALMQLASHCATVVQTRERVVGAAIVLQRAWRSVLDARIGKLVRDVTTFQALARGWAVRRATLDSRKKGGAARRVERVRGGW
ncbi:putative calmodulin-binding protein sha1 protein [Neofusicoccum parvum]|nr:putative calmodulin-binding protein sha1 protein [Neofusicoccum parvum]